MVKTQESNEAPLVIDKPEYPTEIQEENLDIRVVLASASPRRCELLDQAGVIFEQRVSGVDEDIDDADMLDAESLAKKIAERKALAVVNQLLEEEPQGIIVVLGADTMVVNKNVVYGKPKDEQDAKRMLQELSGVTHEVITAVSVWMILAHDPQEISVGMRSFAEVAQVRFKSLSEEDIDAYVASGEPLDKAGAYGIQGKGAALVEQMHGDINTVIGLPLKRLLQDFPELIRG